VPIFLQRRFVIAVSVMVVSVTVIGLSGPAVAQVLLGLMTDGAFLLAWLAAGAGYGALFFRLPKRAYEPEKVPASTTPGAVHVDVARIGTPVEMISIAGATGPTPAGPVPMLRDVVGLGPLKFASAIALGMGAMGLATLLLGLAGLMSRPIAFIMVALGVAIGLTKLIRADLTVDGMSRWLNARANWAWLWVVAAPIVGIVILASFAPPGLLWGDEPNAYDVLEYHLQVPREWYEAGRIHRLDHNVFGYFPQGVEAHFYLAMLLRGGPWAGMYLAQLMHAAMTLLAGAAAFAAAGAVAPRGPATIAGVAMIATPWLALLAPVAYNEGGLLLYGSLAIGWSLHALMRGPAPRWIGLFAPRVSMWTEPPTQERATNRAATRDVVYAALMAGLACGVKLTAGPLLLVGLPLALFAAGIGFRSLTRIALGCVILGVVGLAVFSPWAIRNLTWAGNPLFPEANGVFKSGRFSDVQEKRWKIAHAPTPAQKSIAMRLRAAREQILFDWRFGYVLLPLALVAMFVTRGRPETWFLATLLVVMLIFWLGFTHLQSRFFVLAIPVAALLISQFERRAFIAASAVLVALQAMVATGMVAAKFEPMAQALRVNRAFRLEQLDAFLPEEVREVILAKKPLDLVGDAKAFLYATPSLRYNTVFNLDAASDKPVIDAWSPSREHRDDAYILIDSGEIERLSRTYYQIPNLPPSAPGYGGPPFLLAPHPPGAREAATQAATPTTPASQPAR
jgi:hypothetical protein